MKNADWSQCCQRPTDTIAMAVEILDRDSSHICLVVDENRRLLGTVTDGDIRRGILRSLPLTASVTEVMNKSPVTGEKRQPLGELKRLMREKQVRQIPLVDQDGTLSGLYYQDQVLENDVAAKNENTVVLMAGGVGSRLRPLTEDIPKPMLKVGDKPLLERILESFVQSNYSNFVLSVGYKSDFIKDHFQDGSQWGVSIRYIDDDEQLGTAGSLRLLGKKEAFPMIVMNGDVLTELNIDNLLWFHREQKAKATMCVRGYELQVPYGVVRAKNMRIAEIEEKPQYQFLVNAGIYVLEPEAIQFIPKNQPSDMPDVFRELIAHGYETTVFPIREYWLDIGRPDDYQRANDDALSLKQMS